MTVAPQSKFSAVFQKMSLIFWNVIFRCSGNSLMILDSTVPMSVTAFDQLPQFTSIPSLYPTIRHWNRAERNGDTGKGMQQSRGRTSRNSKKLFLSRSQERIALSRQDMSLHMEWTTRTDPVTSFSLPGFHLLMHSHHSGPACHPARTSFNSPCISTLLDSHLQYFVFTSARLVIVAGSASFIPTAFHLTSPVGAAKRDSYCIWTISTTRVTLTSSLWGLPTGSPFLPAAWRLVGAIVNRGRSGSSWNYVIDTLLYVTLLCTSMQCTPLFFFFFPR